MLNQTDIVDQLESFYYRYDTFQNHRLSSEQVRDTILCLLYKGRIIYFEEHGQIVGYVETWRITFEQFGRKLCHEPFHVGEEDIETGPILYVANVTILSSHRRTYVYKILRHRLVKQNLDAEYFVGHALRKKTQPVKVFKVSKLSLWGLRNGVLSTALKEG